LSQKVVIVTDSSACIPAEFVTEYGIGVVPMSVIFDGRTYRDGVDMSPTEFYSLLRRAKNLPTTAHSSPGAHLEVFRRASQAAPNILCITLSGRFSGQCQSARVARELAKEALPGVAIEVMDSGTAAAAEGFVVLAAAREAARGSDLTEVAARARQVASEVRLVAMLDTLSYLVRGGHVPKAAAWASALFRIKPILTLNEGEAHALARVRTTPRAIDRMMEILRGQACPPPLHVAVMHADALENALVLKERIAAAFAPDELLFTEFTPVMGAHIGPGLIGVAFYGGE
jgi:DegV family protein with EDD domain